MTETRTFCDCCGIEVGGWGDKELFVVMTVGKSGTAHYCFGCAKELLDAWNKKTEEIQKNKKLKNIKQKNLIDVDKLREKLGFAESCEKCKHDSWHCGNESNFSLMDFCTRLDIAIEELTKEGKDK